jgi:hypothetical protein
MICSVMLILSIHRLAIATPETHIGRRAVTGQEQKTAGWCAETRAPAFAHPKQQKRSRQRTGIYVKNENWWTGQYEQIESEQR